MLYHHALQRTSCKREHREHRDCGTSTDEASPFGRCDLPAKVPDERAMAHELVGAVKPRHGEERRRRIALGGSRKDRLGLG